MLEGTMLKLDQGDEKHRKPELRSLSAELSNNDNRTLPNLISTQLNHVLEEGREGREEREGREGILTPLAFLAKRR